MSGPLFAQEFSRSTVQTIFRDGVPHTDKLGVVRTQYDPATSFFTIGSWGVPVEGTYYGHAVDWDVLKSAGYNTTWVYPPSGAARQALQNGHFNDMQVVIMGEVSTSELAQIRDIAAYRNRLLGIMWKDEPSAQVPMDQQQATLDAFHAYRQTVDQYLPNTPVFVDDAPGFNNGPLATQWWKIWADSGELTAQDNYPVYPWTTSIGLESPGGIAESISRAVYATDQQKPVWAIIQAFESNDPIGSPFPWRFPTTTQMRAQVFSAIVHGASGVTYFAWDTWRTREPDLIGIAPNPTADGYVVPGSGGPFQATATPDQIQKSIALWHEVSEINSQLQELAPVILSPTVSPADMTYMPQVRNLSAPNDLLKYTNTPIRTLLKKDAAGHYYLFAVNLDDRSMDVDFEMSKSFEHIDLLYEDDGGYLGGLGTVDEFSFHFGPYATHIFKLFEAAPEPIPGDFDGNGYVDGNDLTKWKVDFSLGNGSDADGDGDSDGNDFLIWQRQLGQGTPPNATPVPEPAWGPLSLLTLGVAASWRHRRGQRHKSL